MYNLVQIAAIFIRSRRLAASNSIARLRRGAVLMHSRESTGRPESPIGWDRGEQQRDEYHNTKNIHSAESLGSANGALL
jgi:hypothetical protein